MKKVILKIDGLPNSTSAMKLERLLNKNSSIKSAAVHWKQKKATIQYQEPMTIEEIEQMIKEDQIIDSKILAVLTLYKNKIL